MNRTVFLLLTVLASVQCSVWHQYEQLANMEKLFKPGSADSERKLSFWPPFPGEEPDESPSGTRMLKAKKDKKKPKKPKKNCQTISVETSFPDTLQFLELWNMTESEIGSNIVWTRYLSTDDAFGSITSVSTVIYEDEFIDYNEFYPEFGPFYMPKAFSGLFTEVLTFDDNSTITTTGVDTFTLEVMDFSYPETDSTETDWIPTFSALGSVTGGTGQFAGAYGEIDSHPCNLVDALINGNACEVDIHICIAK
mmetsp:Transcript_24773/g.31153  ORF Transcript_24773/g.31153 Transcript_24773/m.31153 type:complete len:252 (+) Transcript_24773:76-831(+)